MRKYFICLSIVALSTCANGESLQITGTPAGIQFNDSVIEFSFAITQIPEITSERVNLNWSTTGNVVTITATFSKPPKFQSSNGAFSFIVDKEAEPAPKRPQVREEFLGPRVPDGGSDQTNSDSNPTVDSGNDAEAELDPNSMTTLEIVNHILNSEEIKVVTEESLQAREFAKDTAIPESPAAAVIPNSSRLIRLNTAKDFQSSVINFLDKDGRIKTGGSFALRPFRVFARPTLTEYLYGNSEGNDLRDGYWVRFMSRMDLSFAATLDQQSGESSGSTLAFGLSGYIFDKSDARVAIFSDQSIKSTLDGILEVDEDDQPFNDSSSYASSNPLIQFHNDLDSELWNNSYWAFGFAPRFNSPDGFMTNLDADGGSLWTTLNYGFENISILENTSQFLLHLNYRDNLSFTDPNNDSLTIQEDVWSAVGQLRIGSKFFNGFAELGFEKHNPGGRQDYDVFTYRVGIDKRLYNNLWLVIDIGSEDSETMDQDLSINTALNYAFGDSISK